MQYKILVYEQNNLNNHNILDLYDDIDISLNFTLNDIRNLGAFNSNYSKTIFIPASSNNNLIFDNVYNINKSIFKFDKNKSLKCIITYDDITLASGSLTLNTINYVKNDAYQYECIFYGDVYSIYDKIGTQSVYNLNWSLNNLPEFTISSTNYSSTASYGTTSYKGIINTKTRNWFNIGTSTSINFLSDIYKYPDSGLFNKFKSSDELIYLPNNYNSNFIDLNYTTSNLFTQSNFYNNRLYPSPILAGIHNFENDATKYSTLRYRNTGNLIRRYRTLDNYNFPVFDWRLLYIKILKENGYTLTSDSYNYLYNKDSNIYNKSYTEQGFNVFADWLLFKTDYSNIERIIDFIKPVVDYTQTTAITVSNVNYLQGIYTTNSGNSYYSYSIANAFTYSELYPLFTYNNNLTDNNIISNLLVASISYNNLQTISLSSIATHSFQSNKFIFSDGNKNSLNGLPFNQDVYTSSTAHYNRYDNKAIMSDINDADFDKYTFFVTHNNLLGKADINSNPINEALKIPFEYNTYGIYETLRPSALSTYYGSSVDNKSQILRNFRNDNIIFFNSFNRVGLEFQDQNIPPTLANSNYEADLTTNQTINLNEYNYHYSNSIYKDKEVFNSFDPNFNFGKYIVEQPNYYQFEAGLFSRLEFYSPNFGFGTSLSTPFYYEYPIYYAAGTYSIYAYRRPYKSFVPYYGAIGKSITYDIRGTYSYEIGIFVEKSKDNYDIPFNSINKNEFRNVKQIGTLSYTFNIDEFYTYRNNGIYSTISVTINGYVRNFSTYKDDSTSATVSLHSISNEMKAYVGTTSTILSTTGSGGTISVSLPYNFDSFSKYTTDPKWSSTVSDKVWLDKGDKVFLQYLTKTFDDGLSLNINPQGFDYGIKKDGVRLLTGRGYANDIKDEIESGYEEPNDSFVENLYPVIDYYVGYTASANYDYESNLILGSNSQITNRTIDYYGKKQFGFTDGNFFTGYMVSDPSHISISTDQQVKIEADIYLTGLSFSTFESKKNFNTYSNSSIYDIPDEIMEKGVYLLDYNETTPLSKHKAKVIDYFTIGNDSNNATVSISKFYNLEKGFNRYAFYIYNGMTVSSLTASLSTITIGTNSRFKLYSVKDTDFIRTNDKIFINEDVKQSDVIKHLNRIYNLVMLPDNKYPNVLKIYPYDQISRRNNNWSEKLDLDSDYTISTNNILLKGYSIEYKTGEDKYSKQLFNGLSPNYDRLLSKYTFGDVANQYSINFVNYTNKTKDNVDIIIDDFTKIQDTYILKGIINNNFDISLGYLNTKNSLYANTQAIVSNSNTKYYFNNDDWGIEVTGNKNHTYNTSINYRLFTPSISESKKYFYQIGDDAPLISQTSRYIIDVESENSNIYNTYKNGYILTCYINISLLDITKLQLQDYIILNLDGNKSKWLINKIFDYSPLNKLTKIELIKQNNN